MIIENGGFSVLLVELQFVEKKKERCIMKSQQLVVSCI